MPLMSAIPLKVRRWPGSGDAVTVAADGRPEDLVVAVSA
jgi:hypothetical protein